MKILLKIFEEKIFIHLYPPFALLSHLSFICMH